MASLILTILEFEKACRFFSTLCLKSRNMSFAFSMGLPFYISIEKNRKKDYYGGIIMSIDKVFQVLFSFWRNNESF